MSNSANSSERPKSSSTSSTTTNYRLEAKNFFLTFPQCTTTKEQALENIRSRLSSLKGVCVAQEKHADGHQHLHIALFLNERLRTRDPRYFDFVASSHGNYQTMKKPKECLRYVRKEDPQPLNYGELPNDSEASSQLKSDQVAEMIASGSTLPQVAQAFPGFFLLNKRKIEDYQSFCSQKRRAESRAAISLPLVYSGQRPGTASIIDWLNTNLRTTRPFKAPQIYIHGPQNYCKTTLVEKLAQYFTIYRIPGHEDFYDSYNDSYDLCVLDEFKANKTIQWLNEFLQGSEMVLRKKGSQYLKTTNPPVIILSNYAPDEVYKDQNKIQTLLCRLKVVHLEEPIEIDKINF